MSGRWGPTQYSSGVPWWPNSAVHWNDPFGYDPVHWLLQNPTHRYNQIMGTPKRTAIEQLRHPQNYVIPRSTYVPPPNPYTDRAWIAMWGGFGCHTREEIGRNGQDAPLVRGW